MTMALRCQTSANIITLCGTCFELEPSIGKSSVDHKVEDLVELDDYDTEQISNIGWSELENWIWSSE